MSGLMQNLPLLLDLLLPGFVFLSVRYYVIAVDSPPAKDMVLSYLLVSMVYHALMEALGVRASSFLWVVVVPAILGFVFGVGTGKNWFRNIMQRCGLSPLHHIRTAWDRKFGDMSDAWVLVTLKDGTRFAGFFGPESFASSDPSMRDIYIQLLWDISDDNIWTEREKSTSVLIVADEVKTIEFWPRKGENQWEN